MSAPLNVLIVNTHQQGGGAGRVGADLAAALRASGDQVTAYVRQPRGLDGQQRAGTWRETGWLRWLAKRGLTDLGHVSSLAWPFRPEFAAADVLHLHNLHGDYASIAALPWWGRYKPIVWTVHDFWPLTGNCAAPGACTRWRQSCGLCRRVGDYPLGPVDRTRFYRRVKPALVTAARPRLVIPSRYLADRVRELPQFRHLSQCVIRPPIDCQVFAPHERRAALRAQYGLRPEGFTVALVGNHWADPQKGADQAVAALRSAAALVRGLQVLVVGHCSEQVLSAARLPGAALPFLARRAALAEVYACADLCLFPSRFENYPLTVLEAMACQTPVVAYAVGGVPEQIDHMRTGYVAPDGRPEQLACGIVRLAREPALIEAMGARARAFVVRTSRPAEVAAQYRAEYRRAIATWCARRAPHSPQKTHGAWTRHLLRFMGWETAGDPQVVSPDAALGLLVCTVRGGEVG